MKTIHQIGDILFDGDFMEIVIDGKEYQIDLKTQSPKLASTSETIKNNYKISPSGYGIRWPDIDEDLSVDGLLRDVRETSRHAKI